MKIFSCLYIQSTEMPKYKAVVMVHLFKPKVLRIEWVRTHYSTLERLQLGVIDQPTGSILLHGRLNTLKSGQFWLNQAEHVLFAVSALYMWFGTRKILALTILFYLVHHTCYIIFSPCIIRSFFEVKVITATVKVISTSQNMTLGYLVQESIRCNCTVSMLSLLCSTWERCPMATIWYKNWVKNTNSIIESIDKWDFCENIRKSQGTGKKMWHLDG